MRSFLYDTLKGLRFAGSCIRWIVEVHADCYDNCLYRPRDSSCRRSILSVGPPSYQSLYDYYRAAFGVWQCKCCLEVSWAPPTKTDLQGDSHALPQPTEMACQEVCTRQARERLDPYFNRLRERILIPQDFY